MRKVALFVLIIHAAFNCFGQLQPYNKAFIWRGFQHQWTYNHRCTRLGDYVQLNSGTPIAVHTCATGIGADSAYYTSYYTYVETPDAVFLEGDTTIKIYAKEKQLIEKTVELSIPAPEWSRHKSDYVTLINGFDLRSDKASDKIQLMRFSVEDGVYDAASKTVHFSANVSMVLNCQSIECPEFTSKVIYDLNLHFLIIGFDKGKAAATDQFFARSYSWDRHEELDDLPQEKVITGDAIPFYTTGTVGIKSFSFALNEAHWLLAMNNNITPSDYSAVDGSMKLSIDMLFKEWQEGMRESSVAHKSKFSEKRKGWAMMDLDAVLLQFKKATINYGQHTGRMYWRNSSGSPNGNYAKEIYDIPFP
jgi:hypothetical protein